MHDEELPPTDKEIKIDFNVVQVSKLDLEPGDVLIAKCRGSDFEDPDVLRSLQDQFKLIFPYNKILVMNLGDNDLDLEIVKATEPALLASSCSTGNYCADCSCGKKEQYESAGSSGCGDDNCCG